MRERGARRWIGIGILCVVTVHIVMTGPSVARGYAGLVRALSGALERGGFTQPYQDDHRAMLSWAAGIIPERAVILYLSPGPPEGLTFFRASYDLYPRAVWSGTPLPLKPGVDWHIQTPLTVSDFTAVVERKGITHLLVVGFTDSQIPLAPGVAVHWYRHDPPVFVATAR
jgi:hypothetical protein